MKNLNIQKCKWTKTLNERKKSFSTKTKGTLSAKKANGRHIKELKRNAYEKKRNQQLIPSYMRLSNNLSLRKTRKWREFNLTLSINFEITNVNLKKNLNMKRRSWHKDMNAHVEESKPTSKNCLILKWTSSESIKIKTWSPNEQILIN
jgi:hypothetical protein